MSKNQSSNQCKNIERKLVRLENRVREDCRLIDSLRSRYIELTCPFKPGDTVKYLGLDKVNVIYKIVRIVPRGHSYRLVCRSKGSSKQSVALLSPVQIKKIN